MAVKPFLEAEVTFLSFAEGGRVRLPDLSTGRYMPHLVVQEPHVRNAIVGDGNVVQEDYLGVAFVASPLQLVAGRSGRFTLELMYHPQVQYDELSEGTTFTVREGGKVVGFGKVIGQLHSDID